MVTSTVFGDALSFQGGVFEVQWENRKQEHEAFPGRPALGQGAGALGLLLPPSLGLA